MEEIALYSISSLTRFGGQRKNSTLLLPLGRIEGTYSLTQSAVHKDVPTTIESDPGERPSSSIAREIPQNT